MTTEARLDDPARGAELQQTIRDKAALRSWYEDVYRRYCDCLGRCPQTGIALEIGSGGGFANERIPGIVTSDILPYRNVSQVLDAATLPFADGSLRFIGMLNVFHHLPRPEEFLNEAARCLMAGGRMLIVDQHRGWISRFVLKYLHHEPFRPDAREWPFSSEGPLSGANGALAWIVFNRDRARFEREYPSLRIVSVTPHSALVYWLAGGLKPWSLLGGRSYRVAASLDHALCRLAPDLGSFVDIEVERTT